MAVGDLGADLVPVPAVKGVGGEGTVSELIADLEALAAQVRDAGTTGRIAKALSALRKHRAWRLREFAVPQTKAAKEKVGVFLRLPPTLAAEFPETEDDSPKHVTLLLVGECSAEEFAKVVEAVSSVAADLEPFELEVTDYGEFTNKEGETIPHMVPRSAAVSMDELHRKLRTAVEEKLGRECAHYPGPFKPHVTLAYVPKGESYDGPRPQSAFEVSSIEVWGAPAGEFGRVILDLETGETQETQDAAPAEKAQTSAELHDEWVREFARFLGLKKDPTLTVLSKASAEPAEGEEERTVFGIVLEPETIDAQNDIYSEDEVRKTAYRFMERYQQFGLMHEQVIPSILPLESYLAPVDMAVGSQQVKKGTWLLRVRVLDDGIWQDVKSGRLTGFSIGGSAIRRPEKRKAA